MKQINIDKSYLLLKKWWESIDLTNYEKCNLNNVISYLNSDAFKDNFIFSGRFKIGHRQLSNSLLPLLSL